MMNVSAIEVGRNAPAEPAPFQDPSINLSMEEGRRADVANKSFADPVLEGSFVARERATKADTVPDLNDTFGDFHQGACWAIWARLNDPASDQTIARLLFFLPAGVIENYPEYFGGGGDDGAPIFDGYDQEPTVPDKAAGDVPTALTAGMHAACCGHRSSQNAAQLMLDRL